jgi:hypothetical protein
MSTRALAADNEQVVAADTYVSSNLAFAVKAVLPAINAGAGGTVAVDKMIRVESLGAAPIELVTVFGRRVGVVPSRSQAVVAAIRGAAQSEPDEWAFFLIHNTPSAFQTISPSPTQAEVTALRDCLVNQGLMKAE